MQEEAINNYMIASTTITVIFQVFFLLLYCIRVHKLDRMASNNTQYVYARLLIYKIILIVILVGLIVVHIILSQADQYYLFYAHYSKYGMASLLTILLLLLQIYIINKQHKKFAVRAKSINILWIVLAIKDFITVIIFSVSKPPVSKTIAIFVCKLIVEIALLILSFGIQERQKRKKLLDQQFKQSIFLPDTIKNTEKVEKIYIEFNKQFEIIMQKQFYQCEFKIAVYFDKKHHIINKKENEFQQLSQKLQKLYPNDKKLILPQWKHSSHYSTMMKYCQQRQQIYQQYLLSITQNSKYQNDFLFNFLNIPSEKRNLQMNNLNLYHKYFNNHQQQLNHQQNNNNNFFHVSYIKNTIWVNNPKILQIAIYRSNTDIKNFHDHLINNQQLKLELISDSNNDQERIHFLSLVSNNKFLWRYFSKWMTLDKQIEQKIFTMLQLWNNGIKHLKMRIQGHKSSFDPQDSSIHIFYQLILSDKCNQEKSINNSHPKSQFILQEINNNSSNNEIILNKRYNNFVKLDRQIRKFLKNNHIKVQPLTLPPKSSPFGSKTSAKSRQVYFNQYIKHITQIQDINHCIAFLEFLELQNPDNVLKLSQLNRQIINKEQSKLSNSILENNLSSRPLRKL